MEETKEGYAISPSKYPVHQTIFIQDDLILKIYSCSTVTFTDQYPIGIYPDGKVMVQQGAIKTCVAACAAMLIEDHHKKCNVKSLRRSGAGNDRMLIHWLHNAGFQASCTQIASRVSDFADCLFLYGSLACCIIDKEIGGHEIILDHIDFDCAVIRDPFHGWRIRIPTDKFLALTGSNPKVIFITG
ncbi:MAG: hypothetical protein H0V82_00405 [Candidatus Protochlamydia sp.]|nr:hypothetical protein [Candidatus Protochlamydia sp.]